MHILGISLLIAILVVGTTSFIIDKVKERRKVKERSERVNNRRDDRIVAEQIVRQYEQNVRLHGSNFRRPANIYQIDIDSNEYYVQVNGHFYAIASKINTCVDDYTRIKRSLPDFL